MFICINRYNLKPLVWVDENSVHDKSERVDMDGKRLKPWYVLLERLVWHMENFAYDYSYESYHSKGIRVLQNLKLVNG